MLRIWFENHLSRVKTPYSKHQPLLCQQLSSSDSGVVFTCSYLPSLCPCNPFLPSALASSRGTSNVPGLSVCWQGAHWQAPRPFWEELSLPSRGPSKRQRHSKSALQAGWCNLLPSWGREATKEGLPLYHVESRRSTEWIGYCVV